MTSRGASKRGRNDCITHRSQVWLLKVGEKVPSSVDQVGLMRTGSMARAFSDLGFDVTWWTGDFDHFSKKHFNGKNQETHLSDSYRLRYLYSSGYQKNISLRRFRSHRQEAIEFRRWAARSATPKLIVAAMPTIDLALAAAEYASKNSVPLILDIRDLWPEIFVDHIERRIPLPGVRSISRGAFKRQFENLKTACRLATGITGVGPKMVEYGLGLAEREQSDLDGHVWIGSNLSRQVVDKPTQNELLQRLNVPGGKKLILYVGTFSEILETQCLADAVRTSEKRWPHVHFVFCGRGDHWQGLSGLVSGLNNISMPGWVDREDVQSLMSMATVGLIPFKSRKDFQWSLPNKTFEYLRCGLPIVSPLRGELEKLLKSKNLGLTYQNNDSQGLVSALAQILEKPGELDFFKQQVELVSEEFDSRSIYRNWVEDLAQKLKISL